MTREEIKARLAEIRREKSERKKAMTQPRYDAVFFEGLEALDRMAHEPDHHGYGVES